MIATEAKKDIEQLAVQAAHDLLAAMPPLVAAQPFERHSAITLALLEEQGSATELKSAVQGDSSFGNLRGAYRLYKPHEQVSDELFARICAGVEVSEFTSNGMKKYFRSQTKK